CSGERLGSWLAGIRRRAFLTVPACTRRGPVRVAPGREAAMRASITLFELTFDIHGITRVRHFEPPSLRQISTTLLIVFNLTVDALSYNENQRASQEGHHSNVTCNTGYRPTRPGPLGTVPHQGFRTRRKRAVTRGGRISYEHLCLRAARAPRSDASSLLAASRAPASDRDRKS